MKKYVLTACLITAAVMVLPVHADSVTDKELGLSKTSVFDTAIPSAFDYGGLAPGAGNELLPKSYDDAPPQIPHSVVGLMPVTAKNNLCVGCHVQPENAGKEVAKGLPTPVSASHYDAPAFGKPAAGLAPTASKKLSGSRFACTLCHAPQAKVDPLVQSNFGRAMAKRKVEKK